MAKLTLKDLKNLQEDEELDLSAMQLTEFPLALPMVSRLSTVDLSQNSIAFLPNEICKMNRLIRLDLGKNRIHHLPNDIGNLTSLQHLNLQGNDIEELPLSFANLKSLKWLDLRNNPLEDKLAKAAGNCGNDKECQAAAKNVLNFVSERKKFIEYQKEKENKVNEKIKLKNVEEKKKAAKANGKLFFYVTLKNPTHFKRHWI
ncbi:unnamed protein product [Caenorhabditis angaria]|uniref:Leucine-rich repeat-containing protein 59 n=1 Tax=Caenorhabditis angaria TaxID=860376 RepID=A0A9P1IMG3_9PELO|nr:unnamed protein product [Caenorhabditis angaria]